MLVAQCFYQEINSVIDLPLYDFNFGNNIFQRFSIKIWSGKNLIDAMNFKGASVKIQVKKFWVVRVDTAVVPLVVKTKNVAKF